MSEYSSTRPLRIVIFSYWYLPHLGGQQVRADMLATEFTRRGHTVDVVTAMPDPETEIVRDFAIHRGVGLREQMAITRRADACLVIGPSVRYVLPSLLLGKPVLVSHAAPFMVEESVLKAGLQWLSSWLASWTVPGHGPSRSIARHLPRRHVSFANPYNERMFRHLPGVPRDGDLLYVGRLSREKGLDTLLEAMARLRDEGTVVRLSVIGAGSHLPELRQLEAELGLGEQITWKGKQYGETVVEEMNRHRVLVVPSRWHEPFGIVALEGLACGCKLVVSRHGGLLEATGPWGIPFENGDPISLAQAVKQALHEAQSTQTDPGLEEHLRNHQVAHVAERYLQMLQKACTSTKRGIRDPEGRM